MIGTSTSLNGPRPSLKVTFLTFCDWLIILLKDDWSDLKQQINNGLNLDRGPIIHTAIQQKRFEIATNLIEHG